MPISSSPLLVWVVEDWHSGQWWMWIWVDGLGVVVGLGETDDLVPTVGLGTIDGVVPTKGLCG